MAGDNVIDLTLDFRKGTVKQAIAKIKAEIPEASLEAINEGADFMVTIAKCFVLVDTGTLRKSIRKERGGTGWLEVHVRAGGYFINPKTGKICNYAHWVEMKYPYMKPAWLMTEPYIRSLIQQKIAEAI